MITLFLNKQNFCFVLNDKTLNFDFAPQQKKLFFSTNRSKSIHNSTFNNEREKKFRANYHLSHKINDNFILFNYLTIKLKQQQPQQKISNQSFIISFDKKRKSGIRKTNRNR